MKVCDALRAGATKLALTSESPRLDAEVLMAHALGISRDQLILRYLDCAMPARFERLIERRQAHEPVAYITSKRDFWTLTLAVSPAVLIPRPDSETLIEAAIAHFGTAGPRRIVDLGTGSGALLLAALSVWPDATGIGVDRSTAALHVARDNAVRLGFSGRAEFVQSNWCAALMGKFDLILCNPPYVEAHAVLRPDVANYEPGSALFAGNDGLDDYRQIIPQLGTILASAGTAILEIGSGQAESVKALAQSEGFAVSETRDLGGVVRCLRLSASVRLEQ